MKAFLFDIDGTLVDSSAVVERVWRQVAREFGVDADPILRNCHGRRDVDMAEEFFEPQVRQAVVERISSLDTEAVGEVVAIPGAQELLAAMEEGRWAVVTSGPRLLMTGRLRAAGLPVPAVLVSSDDVQAGKPDPEGFLLAAEALGLSPSCCVVVEDSPAGVAAGKAAGAVVVAITTTHAAADLAGADIVVTALSELPGAVS